MAKKNKPKKKRAGNNRRQPPGPPVSATTGETRAADVLTIGWMLATLATTAALLLGLAALAARGSAALHDLMSFVAGLLLLLAMATGLITLALTWPVLRIRRVPPPRAITIYAVAISVAPLVVVALLQLVG